ncbi:MAG: hypothetical protein GY711_16090 [bacterium]|nr:hypothetical protein [bacterium]
MKALSIIASAAIVAATASPALADGRNPGSALVYPVHYSGNGFFTVICVTNTNTDPGVPGMNGDTMVHYEYANVNENPQDPFLPFSCTIFNRMELLTPADTLCVLTSCHNAVNPAGQQGYVVLSAQDPDHFDSPWSFNFLIGSELVINASGVMYSLNAIPFESPLPLGAATDLDSDSNLDFDGQEYEGIPDVLYIDSFIAIQESQLSLLSLTGRSQDVNSVQFSVWNDNEFPLSTNLKFSCWFDEPLWRISQLFTQDFLENSTPHDPDELDLDCFAGDDTVETGWAIIDSVDVRTTGGLPVSDDGAILGSITAGGRTRFDGGHLLWESTDKQFNGQAFAP